MENENQFGQGVAPMGNATSDDAVTSGSISGNVASVNETVDGAMPDGEALGGGAPGNNVVSGSSISDNAAVGSAVPAATKNKGGAGKVVLIVVAILCAVLAAVMAFLYVAEMGKNADYKKQIDELTSEKKKREEASSVADATGTNNGDDPEEANDGEAQDDAGGDDAQSVSRRSEQRFLDLGRLLTAVNSYQSNHNGKTPFESGSVDANFVKRYVSNTCELNSGTGRYDNCGDQFTDPDGEGYGIVIDGEALEDGKTSVASLTTMDHMFHVYTNATCGRGNEGVANKGNGKRQVAIFYYNEDGSIYCNDNH